MAKITLGAVPKNFKRVVKTKILDEAGNEVNGEIECSFVYRTPSEYGKLIDELNDGQQQPDDLAASDVFKRKKERNGEYLMRILDGWGMDAEFNATNAQRLCDEFPGVADAIFLNYRAAIVEGRLGN